MGSSRLPGKVLMPLAGIAVIDHVLARLESAQAFQAIAVATSDHQRDDVLARHVTSLGVAVIRGSEDDVLSRYLLAAAELEATHVMRITADCPLVDPLLLQHMVKVLEADADTWDLVTNARIRSYPRGLDAELVRTDALQKAACSPDDQDREHVTRYIYRHPGEFRIRDIVDPVDRSHLRWTLDEPADYRLLSTLFDGHFSGTAIAGEGPSTADVLAMLHQHPEWNRLNAGVHQKPDLSQTLAEAKEQP